MARSMLFTIGYQGRTPAQLIRRLRDAAVTRVIDVRASPRSPRPGFSRSALARSFAAAGIEYLHMPEAGNPFHEDAATDLDGVLARYRHHLGERPEVVTEVLHRSAGARCALLCAEADARRCHRSVLVESVGRLAPDLAIVNL